MHPITVPGRGSNGLREGRGKDAGAGEADAVGEHAAVDMAGQPLRLRAQVITESSEPIAAAKCRLPHPRPIRGPRIYRNACANSARRWPITACPDGPVSITLYAALKSKLKIPGTVLSRE